MCIRYGESLKIEFLSSKTLYRMGKSQKYSGKHQGSGKTTSVCWIPCVQRHMLKPCGWQEDSEKRGFAECWRSQESSFWINWVPPLQTLVPQVWDGPWHSAFLTSLQVMLMQLVFGLHFSCKAKRWAASSSGRRTEQGTPRRRCPILLLCFWPLPSSCPLPGVPLHCGWPLLHLVLPNGEAV